MQSRGGVDHVAGDHALGHGTADRGGLAGQDAGPGLELEPLRVAEHLDTVDQLEGGPDRPLGVVFVRDRCPPHGHDRVADELLDDPAVALDDRSRHIEVGAQERPDVLRVTLLGHRGEADQIEEQDRDETPLRATRRLVDGSLGRRCGRGLER